MRQLARGEKIFVYRLGRRTMGEAELRRLYYAIRAHGPGSLLYVRRAARGEQAGWVEQLAPGLLVGGIERFAIDSAGQTLGPATREWIDLCVRVSDRI